MNDTKCINAWVMGGDDRYPHAVRALRDSGLPVKTYGVREMEDDAPSLAAAWKNADLVLLPMRPVQNGDIVIGDEKIEATLLPQLAARGATVIAGSFPSEVEAWLQCRGMHCGAVLELESYQVANAAVTAEGAVGLALQALDQTLFGLQVLVIGWGRIGKLLAGKLRALGACVTVSARREGDYAEIETLGCRPEETGNYHYGLGDYDLIINTVPAVVLRAEQATQIRKTCVIMELASLPGGFLTELQQERNIIMAQGLPGISAPKTAGKHLAAAVWACLEGEGRRLE